MEIVQKARPREVGACLLAMTGISKRFGGTQALKEASLSVCRGEIVALLGENGAGKSTFIKIMAGVVALDTGSITYNGEDFTHSPRQMPIAFIHQDLGLIEWMTVSENICLSLGYPKRMGLLNWSDARKRAAKALDQLGVDIDPDERVQNLNRTEKSLVAISRALVAEAEVLVLDEPTASLPADEVGRLFKVLRRLRDRGVGMVYVSHRLDEVFDIADRMVVLRDGQPAGDRAVADVTPHDAILMIVGREPSQIYKRPVEKLGQPRLSLRSVCVNDVGPIDADFHAGEVIGLVGLRGAGQEAIGRSLFGLMPMTAGQAMLDDKPVAAGSPREAMAAGIVLVWGDRTAGSTVPTLSVRENFFLNPPAAGHGLFKYISPFRETTAAIKLGSTVHLRPNAPTMPIEALSGGNQQKVVVGRWLHLRGKVYIFEDPTAGVDVGAKAEIYRLFNEVVEKGACIIVVSTDFEEVANVCHRALVFDRGQVVAELHGDQLSVGSLLAAASARVGSVDTLSSIHG
ncbi:sugar ABC transporter ATP-binding protein [Acidisoma cellulosilytica]|uniref:Sugar ABC transporter ATP-binding protein n=1 Tax=Acidisoma cellulosilyticum TaxID=2802395 RepID=A0A964E245_9PROT|nr:sugar ABC transporter ATP-binding protein [Acidisoma cellulosilyticum]MCB8878867.1 sugar ABC transporter ATP-binding protein [Acidisoma cellulosilyticum]